MPAEREYFWFRFCVYLLLTDFVGRILDGASQCVRVSLSRTRTSMDGSIFQFYASLLFLSPFFIFTGLKQKKNT